MCGRTPNFFFSFFTIKIEFRFVRSIGQVDTQEYAFAMRKNSPWLTEINRAMSSVINNGLVTKSYTHHLNQRCPPWSAGENVKPLTLSNLGSLFAVAAIAAVVLSGVKLYLLYSKRQRPKFPMRSLSTQEVCFPLPHSRSSGALLGSVSGGWADSSQGSGSVIYNHMDKSYQPSRSITLQSKTATLSSRSTYQDSQ